MGIQSELAVDMRADETGPNRKVRSCSHVRLVAQGDGKEWADEETLVEEIPQSDKVHVDERVRLIRQSGAQIVAAEIEDLAPTKTLGAKEPPIILSVSLSPTPLK